jgi:hypothetical protein
MDQVHSSSDPYHLIADGTRLWGRDVSNGSIASFWPAAGHFRSSPQNGHSPGRSAWLKRAKSGQNERDRPLSSFRSRSIVQRANSRRVLLRNLQFRIRESYEICDFIMLLWIANLGRDHAVPIFCRFARIPSRCAAKLSERGCRDKTRSVQAIPAMDVHRPLILSDDLMQFDEDLFQGHTVVPLVIVILQRIGAAADILGSIPSGSIRVHRLRKAGFA